MDGTTNREEHGMDEQDRYPHACDALRASCVALDDAIAAARTTEIAEDGTRAMDADLLTALDAHDEETNR